MGTKSKNRVGALALCAAIGCSALCAGSGSITSLRAKTGTAEAEAQTHENALSEQNEIPENANYAADVQYYMGAAAKVAQVGDQSLVENHLTRGADYFDGIRWVNDTNQSGKADTEWWGFATVTSLRPEVKARSKTYTCSIRKFQQVANTTEPLPISKTVALCVTYLLTQVKRLSSETGQRSEF